MAAPRTLALLSLMAGVSGLRAPDCSYLRLLEHLNVTSTNKALELSRPVRSWTSTTAVRLDMLLYGILDVDEKTQTVTSHIYYEMSWKNEFLTWNPSDFCGIDMLTLPRDTIWIPDVAIQEDASDGGSVFHDPVVVLDPGGLVVASTRQRLTFTCHFDLSTFPFDVQRCNITFNSMSSDKRFIDLGTMSNDIILSIISEQVMITQGEWKLRSLETVISERFGGWNSSISLLVYRVTLERKPMLYVIMLIMPLFYLLVLDLASFFIPEDGGEKLSFKVTVLLSISVLLLILKDILPSTEEQMPIMANYCISIFTLVWISVLEAMLVSFLMDLDRSAAAEAERPEEAEEEGDGEGDAEGDVQLKAASHKAESPVAEDGARSKPPGRLKQLCGAVKAWQRGRGRGRGRYRRVARIIDGVFFFLYFVTVLIFVLYLFLIWI
ncbi:5-hydroxytryptamine receptor 3A-like [Cololabis saira]|uniref:5-hydroxytryptamine receptor 3A-like n=1 Tax=Cololabis saira TaxID=129043 RepID=UPI002AD26D93|nr:5-hydroxytryptamine receptor 3A-like [Cololabis saira]